MYLFILLVLGSIVFCGNPIKCGQSVNLIWPPWEEEKQLENGIAESFKFDYSAMLLQLVCCACLGK